MDLQKPKKSRPEARNDQDDNPEYRVNGYKSTGVIDGDDNDPRQDPEHETAVIKLEAKNTQPLKQAPKLISLPVRSRPPPKIMAARIPKGISLDTNKINRLRYADMMPPVSKETLSELDLERIMQNIQLRMDANFEPELHFLPDLDGEKGRQKKIMADDYWEAMSMEIMIYTYANLNRSQVGEIEITHVRDIKTLVKDDNLFQPRLPVMFETLHGILMTLVPERDHASVSQNLDVALLMQQVHKGVLDLASLSNWLAHLLKMHCAPMRDQFVDEMAGEIALGSTHADVDKVISGLRKLFTILEMMKLDVANHQLGAFRIILIEGTIPFLQDYFSQRLVTNELKVEKARSWYQTVEHRTPPPAKTCVNQKFLPLLKLIRGLCDLLFCPDEQVKFPETFEFDLRRLWFLRSEIKKIINCYACLSLQEGLIENASPNYEYTPSSSMSIISRITAILEDTDTSKTESSGLGTPLPNDSCVAMELARMTCEVMGHPNEVSDDILEQAEDALKKTFYNSNSMVMKVTRYAMYQQLLDATSELAQRYVMMSPLAICEAQRGLKPDPHFSHVSKRLAHIAVLHWRVWAPLVYTHTTTPQAPSVPEPSA